MALTLTRDNMLARFGGYRSGASSLIHGATSALKHELHPAMRTGAVSVAAFTFGVIQGKYHRSNGLSYGEVPVDMLSAAAFHTVALFGFAKSYAPILQALGDGALSAFLSATGSRVGQRWADGGKFIPSMLGAFVGEDKPVSGGSSIADEELRKLARG